MYYCRFADLITDADICEMSIPFSLDRRIIVPGTFSAEIEITNEIIAERVRLIVPQKTIVHVYRNEIIIGSYIIWAKQYDGSESRVKAQIQGATLESYLYRRIIFTDLSYTAQEQLDIAYDLVAMMGATVNGYTTDLGITVATYSPSGILRDRTYLYSDGKYIGDLLENLANVDAGFEYVIQTWDDGSSRPREMQFGYDRMPGSANTFLVEQPGDVKAWRVLYDGTRGNTAFYARGAQSTTAGDAAQPTIEGPITADSYLDAGWPILDYVADYQNASEVETLLQYAYWWATNRSGPVTIPSYTVAASSLFDHGFSPFCLGSNVTVVLNNQIFPLVNGSPTYEATGRIIGFQLKVDDKGVEDLDILIETDFDPTDVE